MPTPSPIIETSSGVIVLMSVKPATMKRSRNAVISATSASAMGIIPATSVRNTIRSTISAASRPRRSWMPCSIGGNSASPLYSTVTARGLDGLAHGLLHGLDLRAILGVDHAVELRLRVRDPAVVGERVLVEGVADARDPGIALRRLAGGGELVRLELRDHGRDRRLALGRVEALALGSGEDEIEDAALLLRELRLDQVGRALRVGAGNRELVLQAAAGRIATRTISSGDDPEPGEDDAPRVRGAGPHPARKPARREAFVR